MSLNNQLIGAILQILAFSLLPFLIYLFRKKRLKGFLSSIGLFKSPIKANLYGLGIALLIATPVILLAGFSPSFQEIMMDPSSVTGQLKAEGANFSTIMIIVVMAVFKTGLSEEIFFRGFLGKMALQWFGFVKGNLIQAALFGILHTLLFLTITKDGVFLTFIFVFPAVAAYCKLYVNEKMANGSIVPGWIAHATGNLLAYSIFAFIF